MALAAQMEKDLDERIAEALEDIAHRLPKHHLISLKQWIEIICQYPSLSAYTAMLLGEQTKRHDNAVMRLTAAQFSIGQTINKLREQIKHMNEQMISERSDIERERQALKDNIAQLVVVRASIDHEEKELAKSRNGIIANSQKLKYMANVLDNERLSIENKRQQLQVVEEELADRNAELEQWEQRLVSEQTIQKAKAEEICSARTSILSWAEQIVVSIERDMLTGPPAGQQMCRPVKDGFFGTAAMDYLAELWGQPFPDALSIRPTVGKQFSCPLPATYMHQNGERVIVLRRSIAWYGQIEVVTKGPIKAGGYVMYPMGKVIGTIDNRLIEYEEIAVMSEALLRAICQNHMETDGCQIHLLSNYRVEWAKGKYYITMDWLHDLQSAADCKGLEGLVEAKWLTKEILVLIDNASCMTEIDHNAKPDLPAMFTHLGNSLWEGTASQLLQQVDVAGTMTAQKIGEALSEAIEEGLPGWTIERTRVGQSRRAGYKISRIP